MTQIDLLRGWRPEKVMGHVIGVHAHTIRATFPTAKVGEICLVQVSGSNEHINGEIVGIQGNQATIAMVEDTRGIQIGAKIVATGKQPTICVGEHLLGKVINFLGESLDGEKFAISDCQEVSIFAEPPSPMYRPPIEDRLHTGVRAIDSTLAIGEGQRIGVFAPAGTGKSTLLGMIARGCEADVVVCALIGERGREVREFMEREISETVRERTITVVATSDRTAIERGRAAYSALAICEYFRDRGMKVLLLFDSLTRFARSLRETALASGEPPARRGFPPSVFARLPNLIERAGRDMRGSITAIFTVLVEGEEGGDPISEEAKSLLDGHISLSPQLASAGHYPAIDVLSSISRCMNSVTDSVHQKNARDLRKVMARYKEIEMLIRLGEYRNGNDPVADFSIEKRQDIQNFLIQSVSEISDIEETMNMLEEVLEGVP